MSLLKLLVCSTSVISVLYIEHTNKALFWYVYLLFAWLLISMLYIEETNELYRPTVIAIKVATRQFIGYRAPKY